jgi:hypothetical protein
VRSFARQDEDAGADDRADSKGRELNRAQYPAQTVVAYHFLQQQTERFSCPKLIRHFVDPPRVTCLISNVEFEVLNRDLDERASRFTHRAN